MSQLKPLAYVTAEAIGICHSRGLWHMSQLRPLAYVTAEAIGICHS